MELLDPSRSVLLVIDYQGRLMEMVEHPARIIAVAKRLLTLAEMFEVPVVLTEQYPKGLGPTHPEIRSAFDALATPKRTLEKTAFGCAGDPAFRPLLDEVRPPVGGAPRQVVVAGIEAHVCVMQTVIELLRAGEQVHVVWDAVSGRGAGYVRRALGRMRQAGAVITNHESVGFEWMRDKKHPRFREMSDLFKGGQPA
ncbi:MAG TPA: isochorismatase family protein [Thermoanaerobaculia bacterium]|nr:isochorismatase family protein [Thermoanaerobaculia bacterium]HQR65982.1 isochorismatase family protein [Thermoanaerobaculia bacterium]